MYVCMCVLYVTCMHWFACVYVHMYVFMYVWTLHVCVRVYSHTHTIKICFCVSMYACMPVCLSVCLYVCMYVGRCHMYMCMCIGLYTRMYVLVFFICPSCLAYLENFFMPSIRSCCEPEALRSFPRSPLACSLWDSFRDLPETNPSMPKLQTWSLKRALRFRILGSRHQNEPWTAMNPTHRTDRPEP